MEIALSCYQGSIMNIKAHYFCIRAALFILIAVLTISIPICSISAQTALNKREKKVVSAKRTRPVVRQIPGYIVWSDGSSREAAYGFRTGDGRVERSGFKRHIEFRVVEGEKRVSPAELIEIYTGELEQVGAKVLFRDDERLTVSLDIDGHESWVEVAATDGGYTVTVVEDISASDVSGSTTVTGSLKDVSIAYPVLHPGSDISDADLSSMRPPMVTYFIAADAGDGGDGTEEDPFGSIARAFEHAEALEAMKVRVMLAFGDYEGDIVIMRRTDLIGHGGVPKIRGTIDGDGRGLMLENLEIREAQDTGVRQEGGTLEMTNCRIVGTRRSSDRSSGRGVRLSGGATAVITDCVFRSNEGQALLVTGEGTKATCSDLQATYNQVHPSAREYAAENNDVSGTGCFEVSGGAKLQMEEFDLFGNEYIGVLVRDGSSAHLRSGRIDGTVSFGNHGGFNLTVLHECAIELQHFITSNAVCGVHMFHSTLRVIDIELIGNSIGISFQEPPEGYDLGACLYAYENNIRMQDNAINFDGTALTVPDAGDIAGDNESGEEAEPWCPEVPWE